MNRRADTLARKLAELEAGLGVDEATRARCRKLYWLAVETLSFDDETRARCRQFAAVAAPMDSSLLTPPSRNCP